MASIRERILAQAKLALEQASVGGTTKPTGLDVHRSFERPATATQLPDQTIYLSTEPTGLRATGGLDRQLRIRVRSRVKVTAGTPGDQALDPLVIWAEKVFGDDERFQNAAGAPADGLAFQTTPVGIVWDGEERHEEFAQAVQEFEIHYQTTRGDPEAL